MLDVPDQRPWLTVKETAALTHHHEQTVRGWKRRGVIITDPERFAKKPHYLIYYPSVEDYLKRVGRWKPEYSLTSLSTLP